MLPWAGFGLAFGLSKAFPQFLWLWFTLNIWILSVPHTFSTLTRSDRRERGAIFKTIFIFMSLFGSVLLVSHFINFVLIFSFYFFWQQFHYSKQNFGIARYGKHVHKAELVDHCFFLLVPLISVLGLFSSGPQVFFSYLINSPFSFSISRSQALILNLILLVSYLGFRRKVMQPALQHVALFSMAYLGIESFAVGWLCLNVFHNLQYLKFMFRFENRIQFLILPLMLSLALYGLEASAMVGFSFILALNFTHYVLDGIIWRRRAVEISSLSSLVFEK